MEVNSGFLKLYCKKRMSHIYLLAMVSAFKKKGKAGRDMEAFIFFAFVSTMTEREQIIYFI